MTNNPGDKIDNDLQTDLEADGDDQDQENDIEGRLGKKSGRHGHSQESIATIVKSFPKGTHVTAAEVYEKALELGYELSLSTVYRNLHRLKADGNVNTVSGERGMRYEPSEEGPDHDHLICLGCGLTIEFIDDLIRGFGKSVAQRKGFEHRSSRFDILGYCGDCRAKDETYRLKQATELILSSETIIEESLADLRFSVDLIDSRKPSKAHTQLEATIDRMSDCIKLCQQALAILPKSADEKFEP
ncbi:MAG: transcriptional repressor [Leptolyngbya sp.]|nr:transcriptional repressor [Candidatus Melainabacteria bacterium]